MKYIATEKALFKLNIYNLTELEVAKEFKANKEVMNGEKDAGEIIYNWKNEDLMITPIGKHTALITEYGVEIKGNYEDLPEIEYKDNKWKKK